MGEAAQLATGFFQALSNGDVAAAVAMMADDGEFQSPIAALRGHDQITGFLAGFDTAFPGARYDISMVVESGDTAAVEGVYSGTNTGPMTGPDGSSMPPTGRPARAPFMAIFQVAGGRITAQRVYWDAAGFMAQLSG